MGRGLKRIDGDANGTMHWDRWDMGYGRGSVWIEMEDRGWKGDSSSTTFDGSMIMWDRITTLRVGNGFIPYITLAMGFPGGSKLPAYSKGFAFGLIIIVNIGHSILFIMGKEAKIILELIIIKKILWYAPLRPSGKLLCFSLFSFFFPGLSDVQQSPKTHRASLISSDQDDAYLGLGVEQVYAKQVREMALFYDCCTFPEVV